jgi:choline-sulfatase
MYEESVGIPMLLSGENVMAKGVVKTPVSLIDVFPTILDSFNLDIVADIPGRSLFEVANESDNEKRLVLSEYHGAGSISGAFMLRDAMYKYIHYVDCEPELYNLKDDPEENNNLAKKNDYQKILNYYQDQLHSMVDPKTVNSEALADQSDLIMRNGGINKILDRGGLNGTPVPGGGSTRVDLN